jgi:hypothetical protein
VSSVDCTVLPAIETVSHIIAISSIVCPFQNLIIGAFVIDTSNLFGEARPDVDILLLNFSIV